jgi:hypothetical protein
MMPDLQSRAKVLESEFATRSPGFLFIFLCQQDFELQKRPRALNGNDQVANTIDAACQGNRLSSNASIFQTPSSRSTAK